MLKRKKKPLMMPKLKMPLKKMTLVNVLVQMPSLLISSLNKVMMKPTDLHALLGTLLKTTALKEEIALEKTGAPKLTSGAMLTHLAKEVILPFSSKELTMLILLTGPTSHALRRPLPTDCSLPFLPPLPLLLLPCETI